MDPLNVYLSWIVPMIMGNMAEADALARQYRTVLYKFAADLQFKNRQPLNTLYRGLLLHPSEVVNGAVYTRPGGEESVSFSEDRDVACYFALPGTIVSGYVAQQRPGVEGYIAEYLPRRDEVLWHYKWNPIAYKGRRFDVRVAARMHPMTAHDPAQFDLAFNTQKEVILKPFAPGVPLPVTPVEDTCPDEADLDQRFAPPSLLF